MNKKTRNNIEASREQWEATIARWALLRQGNSHVPASYGHLSSKQERWLIQMQIDPKKLHGQPLVAIATNSGELFKQYPYRGMVLKATKANGEYILRVLFYPSEYEEWN